MSTPQSRYIDIDGIRTHYLEAGGGAGGDADAGGRPRPIVVLLHSGEFGAAAELSWELCLPQLGAHFHVLAPDWLGFGRTDKLYDFADPRARSLGHMQTFVAKMLAANGATQADFIGNSMGATNLLRMAVEQPSKLPIRSMVVASGGGFVPMTPERQTLLAYDGTPQAMRALLRAMFDDPAWSEDESYVERRQRFASMPGAWEFAAAPRLKPAARASAEGTFGKRDETPYEKIALPTLIVAGAQDRLREKGYAADLARKIAGSEVHVLEQCGHCPNIEQAARFTELTIDFLRRVHRQT